MSLHKELEAFLSSAKMAVLMPAPDTSLLFWFGGGQLQEFSDSHNYEMLVGFFAGRSITLVVYREHPSYTFSFVDTEAADCLNISNVRFTMSPDKALASLPADKDIEFDIIGMTADNKYMLEPPDTISEELMILKGYRLV